MPVAATSTRHERLLAGLRERELDALIVTNLVNVRYLTGYTGSNGLVVIGPDVRRFITDFRYVTRAEQEVGDAFEREIAELELARALQEGWPAGQLRVGFEEHHVSVKVHRRLEELVPDRVELVGVDDAVEKVRLVKEPDEVERIRAAAAIGDQVHRFVADYGLVGRTEREVAVALEHQMRVLGAEGPSFPTIVASSEHGALPHAEPREVPIAANTLITFDLGARVAGYCSDATRTFATGELPDDLAEIYAVTLRAQLAALAAVRPGPLGKEVDAVAREIIDEAGYGDRFGHGLGHGVGLDIHEGPRLARSGEIALEPGHIVTVEPGIYLPGRGGVRIEDLVLVTEDGCDVITDVPKELTVVA